MGKKRGGTVLGVGERMIELSSESAVMFPGIRLTKGELVSYYLEVASHMLPYLEDRPLTVERFTRGIGGKGFIQKRVSDSYPAWIRRATVPSTKGAVEHVVADEAATIVYVANQRAVVFHVPGVRTDKLENPDQVIFDFDPPDDSQGSFDAVRQAAGMIGDLIGELGLRPYLKTSGSKGLHIIAPLDRAAHLDEVRSFGREVCELVAKREPGLFTTTLSKKERHGRVFLDYLRNGYAQTVVAPYSVRPKPGAPVSTPLHWDELQDPKLNAQTYTVKNIRARLASVSDPWHDFFRKPGSLASARAAFDKLKSS